MDPGPRAPGEPPGATPLDPGHGPGARPALILVVFVVALLLATLVWDDLAVVELFEAIRELVAGLGWWGVLLFVLIYAAVVLVHAPATPFTLSAGVLYGYWGVPVALAGALLGAVAAFLIARAFVREPFAALCARRPVARAADRAVGELGWMAVLLARLAPIVPFALQNYVWGMTAVPLAGYVWASAIGMVPGTVAKIGIGTLAGRATGEWSLLASSPLLIGIALVLALVAMIVLRTRAILRREPIASVTIRGEQR